MTINIKFGVCNFSTIGLWIFFQGGPPPPRATPKGGGGAFFWDGIGVVHDYKSKVWSL